MYDRVINKQQTNYTRAPESKVKAIFYPKKAFGFARTDFYIIVLHTFRLCGSLKRKTVFIQYVSLWAQSAHQLIVFVVGVYFLHSLLNNICFEGEHSIWRW